MKYLLVLLLAGATTLVRAQELFPQRCIGKWRGTMQISSSGAVRDSVKVLFTVAQITNESWTWRMEYLSPQHPVVKDYVLKLKDKVKLVYSTDEGGGIELMDYQFGNKLYSVFEIPGVLLTASYELISTNTMIFEVTSGKKDNSTGKDIFNYSVGSVQHVVLERI
ncbi:MAG: hypothetical protein ACKOE6_00955 [Flammeovirgaceae bacterium]